MLLTIDVGNTNITMGVFADEERGQPGRAPSLLLYSGIASAWNPAGVRTQYSWNPQARARVNASAYL